MFYKTYLKKVGIKKVKCSVHCALCRLYQSPKGPCFEEDDDKYASPVQWLLEEMESPQTPQLASARKNILYKMGLMESK